MSVQVEKSEHSMAKLTIEIEADKLEGAIQKAYLKQRGRISIPGFRKGKAPFNLVEKKYGDAIFYEDAFNELVPEIYDNAIKENKIEAVSNPEIDIKKMEKGSDLEFTAIVQTKPEIKLGKYKLIGYCIYDDIVNSSSFNIQQIVYNPNTYDSIQKIVDDNQNIIDIREVAEYINTGVIQQAKLIPLNTFKNNYVKVPKEGDVYVFCKSGGRAVVGMSYVKRAGYTNKFIIMRGGMDQAIKEGYPTVPYVE